MPSVKSGYYHFLRRCLSQRALENEQLKQRIQQIYSESRRCYGSPRIHAELKAQNIHCGKHKVARLMKQLGIQTKVHRRKKYNPFAYENYDQGKDRVKRKFSVSKPNTVWVSDITYIAPQEGWVYVVVILDLFSRKVVGFYCSAHMDKTLVITAFEQAIQVRRPPEGLIFHSDRGMQYVNDSFQDYLNRQGVLSSMSRKRNCWDNAVAERFFHTLKTEWVKEQHYLTREQARRSIFEYVFNFYNIKRRHSHLNYLSPAEFEQQ